VTSVPPPGKSVPPPEPGGVRAPARRRPLPVLAAVGASALAAWGASVALAHERPPEVRGMMATGDVRLVSPEGGAYILHADHLFPGQSASGQVELQNVGDADGELQLIQTGLHDVLGLGGGRLSDALRLNVDDVTSGTPHAIFRGALDGIDMLRIGRIPHGATRTYRLTATWPDGGAADNALQGGAVTVDWTWGAVPLPTPKPTPTPEPIKSGGNPAADVLTLRIPWQRVMTTRGITAYGKCDHRCRLTFTAKVQTAPRKGKRVTVMSRRVFRVAGTQRTLPVNVSRKIKLHLSPKAVLKLHQVLLRRGRAAVVVNARVKSSLGTATVSRRIVITTSKRAARHRAARPHR
jgi:hypothetical protein